jgi:flagellar protein FlaJ
MTLNKYQKACYKWFGKIVEKRVKQKLKDDLESSHMNIRGEAYLAYIFLFSLLSFLTSLVVCLIVFFFVPFLGILILPFLAGIFTYLSLLKTPSIKAKARAKKIDANLPYALNFISAMSAAGVTPTEIFKSLSKQEIYGEVKEEAAWIYRDVSLLGADILTAVKNNIRRTPSERFREFLQGMSVTITSGGSLKSYFSAKAQQFMRENRQAQKKLHENLGIMAESYVTTAVAGILLVLIIIPLMIIISGNIGQFRFLYLFIFIVIPLIHLGFASVIKLISMEV